MMMNLLLTVPLKYDAHDITLSLAYSAHNSMPNSQCMFCREQPDRHDRGYLDAGVVQAHADAPS
jgi:hypothetical protein